MHAAEDRLISNRVRLLDDMEVSGYILGSRASKSPRAEASSGGPGTQDGVGRKSSVDRRFTVCLGMKSVGSM